MPARILENYCFLIAGKKYRYFYAISSDVDAENPGTVSRMCDIKHKIIENYF